VANNTDVWFERYYFSRPGYLSGTTEFHGMARVALGPGPPGRPILEIGAGPENQTSLFLSGFGELQGVDVSEEVLGNRHLRKAVVYDGKKLPFAAEQFDLCVSDYVLEHIEDTAEHFREVARVLRPGGKYCFRTPNLLHYVAMASHLLPHSVHVKLANRMRGVGPEGHDPYPTFYRANTAGQLRKLCRAAGLQIEELRMVEKEPSYGRQGAVFFFPMMAYERAVNGIAALQGFRANIFGVVVK
jgi:SAM-dependent methyltransferase